MVLLLLLLLFLSYLSASSCLAVSRSPHRAQLLAFALGVPPLKPFF